MKYFSNISYSDKVCANPACGLTFTPEGPNQQFCELCQEGHRKGTMDINNFQKNDENCCRYCGEGNCPGTCPQADAAENEEVDDDIMYY